MLHERFKSCTFLLSVMQTVMRLGKFISLSVCCFLILQDPRVRSHVSRQAMQGMPVRNTGSPKSAVKTRQAFFLHTTYFTKFARQVCKNTLRLRQAARRPFVAINYAAIRAECKMLLNS